MEHNITLKDRSSLYVSGIEHIYSFNDKKSRLLRTSAGEMVIEGENLDMGKLNLDESVISVEGTINAIIYSKSRKPQESLIKRLFKVNDCFCRRFKLILCTIYGGLIIGLLFDINRSLRSNFKLLKCFSVVFNIIFWILATSIIFITVNAIESFDLRYYHFVALLIGFLLYFNTISKICSKIT